MSGILRFLLRIDDAWNVTIECPGAADRWEARNVPARQLGIEQIGSTKLPSPVAELHDPTAQHAHAAPSPSTKADLAAAYASILGRTDAQVERYGHYLFDAVIGREAWSHMTQVAEAAKAETLELAISLPRDAADLHRLNWELMHTGPQFLAARSKELRVAVTRVVDQLVPVGGQERKELDALESPPKYLWVIGAAIDDDRIRPGAELMGLLRSIRGKRWMNSRVLEGATPRTLHAAINEFKPQIVHIICHGYLDLQGRTYLELQTDDPKATPGRESSQVIEDLRADDGSFPTVVILSACNTAGAGGTERYVLGPNETAPLAVDLVEKGVPIVVGMSGRVGDRTCRIFTRQFGEAVVGGAKLVDALAMARMATFREGNSPSSSVDWALPTLYLADSVQSEYIPMPEEPGDSLWRTIDDWLGKYEADPVFCGRQSLIREFAEMFHVPPAPVPRWQVMAVQAIGPGYGSKRLLQELAAVAVWNGRIPVLINAPRRGSARSWLDFVRALEAAIRKSHFRKQARPVSQLASLLRPPGPLKDAVKVELETYRDPGDEVSLPPLAVAAALVSDLDDLLEDAIRESTHFDRPDAQVVLLLDDIDRWGPEVADGLLDETPIGEDPPLGHHGLDGVRPIPVVFAYSPDLYGTTLTRLRDGHLSETWLMRRVLGALTSSEEALAYRWVLLNPAENDPEEITGKAWAFADKPREVIQEVEDSFREKVQGIPAELIGRDRGLYTAADAAIQDQRLVPADDEDYLNFSSQLT